RSNYANYSPRLRPSPHPAPTEIGLLQTGGSWLKCPERNPLGSGGGAINAEIKVFGDTLKFRKQGEIQDVLELRVRRERAHCGERIGVRRLQQRVRILFQK